MSSGFLGVGIGPRAIRHGVTVTVGNPLVARLNPTDTAPGIFVVSTTALPAGLLRSFQTFNQTDGDRSFHAYVLRPTGTPNEYSVEYDSGLLTVPLFVEPAGDIVTFEISGGIAVNAGDVIGFHGQGIPYDIDIGTDILIYPASSAPVEDEVLTLGSGSYPIYPQTRTYSFGGRLTR